MTSKASSKTKSKHQKNAFRKRDVVFYERPIITSKEAKKFFTKEELEMLSDDDLMRIVGQMKQIAEALLDGNLVPQNDKKVV